MFLKAQKRKNMFVYFSPLSAAQTNQRIILSQQDFSVGLFNFGKKKRRRDEFASLGSSHGFLSMIFGILEKFGIDIGKKIFSKIFFSR